MLLAVSENMIPGAGYGEKLRFLRDHGYDGIELFPESAAQEVTELKQAMTETGIVAPSMRGRTRDLLSADVAERQAQIEKLKQVCALAEDCGVRVVVIVPVFGGPKLPNLAPWRSVIELEEALLDTILPRSGLSRRITALRWLWSHSTATRPTSSIRWSKARQSANA